jgi:DNA-binding MarR family transcriptional regulator
VNILSDQKPLTPEDYLLLDYQLCFPLYAASRLMTKLYQRELEPLGLTYPQYIVLLILWENAPCSVSSIGTRAELASNTLTPLLKRMELMDLVERHRDEHDERVVRIFLTKKGKALRNKCVDIPKKLMARARFPLDQGIALKKQLDSLIQQLHEAIDRDN